MDDVEIRIIMAKEGNFLGIYQGDKEILFEEIGFSEVLMSARLVELVLKKVTDKDFRFIRERHTIRVSQN